MSSVMVRRISRAWKNLRASEFAVRRQIDSSRRFNLLNIQVIVELRLRVESKLRVLERAKNSTGSSPSKEKRTRGKERNGAGGGAQNEVCEESDCGNCVFAGNGLAAVRQGTERGKE